MPIVHTEPTCTVLIVEDSEFTRTLLNRCLTANGCDVLQASDPDVAWRRLNTTRVDLMVLDLHLEQGRSGLELLEQMHVDNRFTSISVVVLTAVTEVEADERALIDRCGAHLVYKSEGYPAIVATLDRLVQTAAAARHQAREAASRPQTFTGTMAACPRCRSAVAHVVEGRDDLFLQCTQCGQIWPAATQNDDQLLRHRPPNEVN